MLHGVQTQIQHIMLVRWLKNINEEWGPLVKVEFTTGNGESESKVTVPMRLENSTSHGVTTMPIMTGKKAQAKFQMIQN